MHFQLNSRTSRPSVPLSNHKFNTSLRLQIASFPPRFFAHSSGASLGRPTQYAHCDFPGIAAKALELLSFSRRLYRQLDHPITQQASRTRRYPGPTMDDGEVPEHYLTSEGRLASFHPSQPVTSRKSTTKGKGPKALTWPHKRIDPTVVCHAVRARNVHGLRD